MSPPSPRRPSTSTSGASSASLRTVPSPPLFDAVVSAFFEQLRHSVADFSESQHWRMIGSWQAQGIPDEVIYDTLQNLFPLHGAPLTLYEELYLPSLSGKGFTPIRQTKPLLASTYIQAQQSQRKRLTQQRLRKTTQLPPLASETTCTPRMYPKPLPAPGTLHQLLNPQQSLDASTNNNKAAVEINVGDYVNVRAAFAQGVHSRGGNGYVAWKEAVVNDNGIDFVFTVAYVNAFLSGEQSLSITESKITRDRLTVLPPSPYLALGNNLKQGIVTVAPTQQPPEIQPPKIPINRLTIQKLAPAPCTEGRHKRKVSTVTTQSSEDDNDEQTNKAVVYGSPTRLSGHENLAEYLEKSHSLHRAKGWRQDDFADVDLRVATVKRELLLQDVIWLEEHLNERGRRKGPKQAKGDSFNSNSFVRNSKSKSSNTDEDNDDNGRSEKIHPLTMRYLAYSWGIGKNTPKELLKRANVHHVKVAVPGVGANSNAKIPEVWRQRSVIECRKTALKYYSAKNLYIRHRITERRRLSTHHELEKYKEHEDEDDDNDDDASSSGSFMLFQYRNDTKKEWDALDKAAQEPWEQKAKWHDEMQPSVQQILVGQITNHPHRTYNDLAIDIGDWCGASTIQRWLTSNGQYLR
jgi:hypothetical protein